MPEPQQQPAARAALSGPLLVLVREQAIDVGMALAKRAFQNRRGHGQTTTVSERHIKEPELAAMLAFGFEHGVEAALRGEFANAGAELPEAAVTARLDAERKGEASWGAMCEAQGWHGASRELLLVRFLRDRGLMAELGAAAEVWAAAENQPSVEEDDAGSTPREPRT